MVYKNTSDDDDIYDISDNDVTDEQVYNTFNRLNLTNSTPIKRDLDSPWRKHIKRISPPPRPRPQPPPRDFDGPWRKKITVVSPPPEPPRKELDNPWRKNVPTNPPEGQQRDADRPWGTTANDNPGPGGGGGGTAGPPRDPPGPGGGGDGTAGPPRDPPGDRTGGGGGGGDEQPQPRPPVISELIQHGRSTPGYPRWRRTQDEITEAARAERGGRGTRQPTIPLPVSLRPHMDTVNDSVRSRIQTRGKWFMKFLPTTSRYYAREPAEKHAIMQGEEHNPYDLMIVLKDAHELQTPEDFMDAVMNELTNAGEYSRDRDSTDVVATGERAIRRMHANTAGWDVLEDFDLILEELNKLQIELDTYARGNSADRLFTSIADAYDWDVTELRKSGFHHEIMNYVGFTMMGRLRYMRDFYRKGRNNLPDGVRDLLDETSITLSTRYFSSAVHSASMADDVRAVEWFSNWAVHFPGRHNREFPRPQLDSATAIGLFEGVYKIKYEHAIRLLSNPGFAEDVEVIDSFLSFRGTIEAMDPARQSEIAGIVDGYFTPYLRRLSDLLTRYPTTNATLWLKYRVNPTNVQEARTRLTQYMNRDGGTTYIGIGRWCRHAPPPGTYEHGAEGKAMKMELWTKGWYCSDHRAWNRCTSCGWKYSCVICSNPHACPHCKTGFRCTWEGCTHKSDDRPTATRAQPTYQVAVTTNPEGWQQNGRRITPILRDVAQAVNPRQHYRKFFPKTQRDIQEDGPIYNRNLSRKFLDPNKVITGGYDRRGRYPVRLHETFDADLGGEGYKFIQQWEVPKRPGDVPQPPGGPRANMALAEGGKRKREDDDEGLLGELLSSLHTARKAKR
ncbi:hypothetical protein F4814DRAFT_410192 [Daldinia grandis]|nr:hypothetical protein F4814DRAFT_410192 [Daldinia grandis]